MFCHCIKLYKDTDARQKISVGKLSGTKENHTQFQRHFSFPGAAERSEVKFSGDKKSVSPLYSPSLSNHHSILLKSYPWKYLLQTPLKTKPLAFCRNLSIQQTPLKSREDASALHPLKSTCLGHPQTTFHSFTESFKKWRQIQSITSQQITKE